MFDVWVRVRPHITLVLCISFVHARILVSFHKSSSTSNHTWTASTGSYMYMYSDMHVYVLVIHTCTCTCMWVSLHMHTCSAVLVVIDSIIVTLQGSHKCYLYSHLLLYISIWLLVSAGIHVHVSSHFCHNLMCFTAKTAW